MGESCKCPGPKGGGLTWKPGPHWKPFCVSAGSCFGMQVLAKSHLMDEAILSGWLLSP